MYAYRSLARIGADIYEVKKIFYQSTIKNVNAVKELLKCTHAFHRDGLLYFCQIIEDAEFTEELHDTEPRRFITEMNCTVIETIYPEPALEEETTLEDVSETKKIEDNG